MSKTLKKDCGQLKFDTSINNLKCFIRAHSTRKIAHKHSTSTSNSKQTMESKKEMEFRDNDFLSSVVCKVLNDANAQEITRLIDNMDFPTQSSEKELSMDAPSEETQHLQMSQIFNVQDSNRNVSQQPENKKQISTQAYYFSHAQNSNKSSFNPQKNQQSTLQGSISLSPQQNAYSYYSSYAYSYMYYQANSYQPSNPRKTKQQSSSYKISLDRIECDPRTTLMIRHIPNKYTEKMLKEQIQKHFKNRTNFLYLPIDEYNQCNVGYAFINFIDTKFVKDFYLAFSGRRWDLFNSEKKCELAYARIQGSSLLSHFQNSPSYLRSRQSTA